MSIRSQSHIDRFPQRHSHTPEERCPLCKQILPQDLTLEHVEERLREKEQQAAKAQEQRLRAQFAQEMNIRIENAKKDAKQQAEKEATEREKHIRQEARTKALEEFKASIAKVQEDKKAAEERLAKMKAEQEVQTSHAVQKALQDQRESLERDKTKEIQKIEAKRFEDNQKLQTHIAYLQRRLEQKSANDLGEGAEIDLYEALREQFDGDDIKRIKKGQSGADILHKIVHNGQVCGSIIYDSKNRRQWRRSFIEKLKKDQLDAKADHAILTTSAFPAGVRQLQASDDVIILNPAWAVELVRIIRDHIVQTHRLRLSAVEREKKTEALYEFITSERCHQLMARHDAITDDLLDLEVKEKSAHDAMWKRRGELLRSVQKLHSDYMGAIDRIIEDGSLT